MQNRVLRTQNLSDMLKEKQGTMKNGILNANIRKNFYESELETK